MIGPWRRQTASKLHFILRTVWNRFFDDRIPGLAAEIAFYEFLTIFPFLIFCVAVLGAFPSATIIQQGLEFLGSVAPPTTVQLVQDWMESIQSSAGATLLSMSGIGALWMGSVGIGGFIDAFTALNHHSEGMGFFKRYFVRVLFTAFGVLGLTLVLSLWVIGPPLVELIALLFGFKQLWQWVWYAVQFPLAIALIILGMMIFYHYLAYSGRRFRQHLPGSVAATLLCWIASTLFSTYVAWVGNFNATYGSLGGIIVLMLWLYALNLSILVGELWNLQFSFSREHIDYE